MQLVAPFFKGIVHDESQDSQVLITKYDPATGTRITDERYVELLRSSVTTLTKLTQDIARTAAAALFAAHQKQHSTDARLISVEGCPHIIGGQSMTGADIMDSIWSHVVPREITSALPPPIIECISDCTVREVRAILAHLPHNGSVQGITHEYHQPRVQRILREEASADQLVPDVLTPEGVVARHYGAHQPSQRFLVDVICAGAPSEETVRRERMKEMLIYSPLHMFSKFGEKITHGAFNLEMFLARRMRK